jgi:hypothetical protein
MQSLTKDDMRFFIEDGQLVAQPVDSTLPQTVASDVARIIDATHTVASEEFYTIKFEKLNGEVIQEDVLVVRAPR